MVSFSCENCGDVLVKKKLDQHRNRCRGASYTCIDCMVYFPGTDYRAHTSCLTEEQKYQGHLYRNKIVKTALPANKAGATKMAQAAYVEEAAEEHEWKDYEDDSDDNNTSPSDLPEAATPPNGREGPVNVFDFFVGNATPTGSNVNLVNLLVPEPGQVQVSEDTQLVRFDYETDGVLDCNTVDQDALIEYGTGPVPATVETPAPKSKRNKVRVEKDAKKDKKRKRLHVEMDQIMRDAPPVAHSGLTGSLNRMMRTAVFPLSPDYSGGDAGENAGTPLKKSRQSKHASRGADGRGLGLMALLAPGGRAKATTKATTKAKKTKVSPAATKKTRLEAGKEPKLLEYRAGRAARGGPKDGKGGQGQMVVFKPHADHFLSLVQKGPESERGCSVNKALKRYHRERGVSGSAKLMDEKELFKSLRLKKNDRGEIVLFCA